MVYYKAFTKDFCCCGLQYAIGETKVLEGDIVRNDLYCYERALSCLKYYPRDYRFCEVVPCGEMVTKEHKTVCRGITVVREIVGKELSDLLTGPCEGYYPDGKPEFKCTYKDGKLDDIYKTWHENGQPEVECSFKDGAEDGIYKSWCDDGQPEVEWSFKDGKLDGIYRVWHENGQLEAECTYKDGKLDGIYKTWHENGQLEVECSYEDGAKDGIHRVWHENGPAYYGLKTMYARCDTSPDARKISPQNK